jgi:hypothetical protein
MVAVLSVFIASSLSGYLTTIIVVRLYHICHPSVKASATFMLSTAPKNQMHPDLPDRSLNPAAEEFLRAKCAQYNKIAFRSMAVRVGGQPPKHLLLTKHG